MTNPPARHPLIASLSTGPSSGTSTISPAPTLPELVMLVGFVSGSVTQPWSNSAWLLMYLDSQLRTWLLVEQTGIVHTDKIANDTAPSGDRDVVWVGRDTAVGVGKGTQSDEARFLTGEFTRAADFDAAPVGGTMAASTGVFCGADTAFCCRRVSQGGG